MAKKRKMLNRQVGVMFSDQDYEILEHFTKRENITLSEFIRNNVMKYLDQFILEEKEMWNAMQGETFTQLVHELKGYLKHHLRKNDKGQYECKNNHYYKSLSFDQKDPGERFDHTIGFCKELNILFPVFSKVLFKNLGQQFNCDCHLLNSLIKKEH